MSVSSEIKRAGNAFRCSVFVHSLRDRENMSLVEAVKGGASAVA